jgi:hypothetical protein
MSKIEEVSLSSSTYSFFLYMLFFQKCWFGIVILSEVSFDFFLFKCLFNFSKTTANSYICYGKGTKRYWQNEPSSNKNDLMKTRSVGWVDLFIHLWQVPILGKIVKITTMPAHLPLVLSFSQSCWLKTMVCVFSQSCA